MVATSRYCIRLVPILLYLAALSGGLLLQATPGSAQTLGSDIGVIDTVMNENFSPTASFVLQEVGPAQIRQYRAKVTPLVEKGKTSKETPLIAIGAPVPLTEVKGPFRFIFLLADDNSRFRSTPVQQWTAEELRMNSIGTSALEIDIRDLDKEIKDKRVEAVELKEQMASVLEKASKLTDLDVLLKLQREEIALKRNISERQVQIKQLELLIEEGRNRQDSADVDKMRKELSLHLRDAAKVTSMADRLNRRQQSAAVQTFDQKVKMVRQMEREDPEALAREVLRLRKKRRELEGRMTSAPGSDSQEGDF